MDSKTAKLSALIEIGRTLSSDLNLDVLLETIHTQVSRIFDTSSFYVAIYAEGEAYWDWIFHIENGIRQEPERHGLEEGVTGYIIRTRRSLLLRSPADWLELTAAKDVSGLGEIPQSWMGVPLLAGDVLYGVMAIQNYVTPGLYDDSDLSLFSTIATQVAVAVQNARLFGSIRRKAEETETLAEIGRDIASSLDLDTVLHRIVNATRKNLTRETVGIFLLSGDGKAILPVAVEGSLAGAIKATVFTSGEGILGSVMSSGKSCIVNDTLADPRAIHIPGTDEDQSGEKLIAVPLASSSGVMGLMSAWRGSTEDSFNDDDLAYFTGLSREAAIAIQNARLYGEAQAAKIEAEQANLAKSQFLANTSHELRTPLNSIINFSWLLTQEDSGLKPDQKDLLHRIEQSGRHLLELINDILDLAKIESGRMELCVEVLDLREVISEAVSSIQGMLLGKPIKLETDIPENLPPVRADRVKLRQIMLNLLSNAIKFTEQGLIRMSARKTGEFMRIDIEDSGIGIKPENLTRAFSEFIQLDANLDRQRGGTGLGLPISKRFTEIMGGTLSATSQFGKGSIFSFTVPLAAGSAKLEPITPAINPSMP